MNATEPDNHTVTARIDVATLRKWIDEIKTGAKLDTDDNGEYGLAFIRGLEEGLDLLRCRLNTWVKHRERADEAQRKAKRLLVVSDVVMKDMPYRKLEWYETNHMICLSFNRRRNERTGRIRLRIMDLQDLSKENFVYSGSHSYQDLAEAARRGGLAGIKQEQDRSHWLKAE